MNPNTPIQYSLAAIGRAGPCTVEILEAADASHLMIIELDSWSCSFSLGEHGVTEILTHLQGDGGAAELKIGMFLGTPVLLIRDDEFRGRYFLRAFKDGHFLDIVFAGDRLAQFTDAVAQATRELGS